MTSGVGTDDPPVPVAATSINDLAGAMRELRAWAGEPSYATLARRVAQLRLARGVPAGEATPGRVTVYDCFRDGRRRLDADLVLDIVTALGADREQRAGWRQAIRRVLMPGSGPILAEVLRDPPAPQPFVGREAERDRIRMAAAQGAVVIEGMPGVGKTALAVSVGHDLAGELGSDGEPADLLLVNLRGFTTDQHPVEPDSVADALLRALGQDAPAEPHRRLVTLRETLARTPVVVVLDNAASAEQVATLLPDPGSNARVLVTSRNHLEGLSGALEVHLGAMVVDEAVTLLQHAAGRDLAVGAAAMESSPAESGPAESGPAESGPAESGPAREGAQADETGHAGESGPAREGAQAGDPGSTAAQADTLAELAQLAGGLPLALSLMGRRLAARPDWPLADHVDAYRGRLQLLQLDQGVQAALELSYAAMAPADQDLLRALSWHPTQSMALPGIQALTGGSVEDLQGTLDRLTAASLVRPVGADRWELHDLIRTFAASRSFDVDSPSSRTQAMGRLTADYVDRAINAMAGVQPPAAEDWWWVEQAALNPVRSDAGAAWLEAERVNVLACAMWAHQHGQPQVVVRLAAVLAHDLWRRGDVETTLELHRAAIAAARELADSQGEALAERNLGNTLVRVGQFDVARPHLDRALGLYDQVRDERARVSVLSSLAIVASATGDQDAAIAHFFEIVEVLRQDTTPQVRLAISLSNLAVTLARAGRRTEAIELFGESAELAGEQGWEEQERVALSNLAGMLVEDGEAERGLEVAQRAVQLTERVDDPLALAYARSNLGVALHVLGRHEEADELWEQALAAGRETAAPDLEASVLNHIGDGHRRLGEVEPARTAYQAALELAEQIGEANEAERAKEGLRATMTV